MLKVTSYYLVEKASPVMPVITQAVAERAMLQMAHEAYKNEINASAIIFQGGVAARFSHTTAPKGWRWDHKLEAFVPNRGSKEGKAVLARIEALPKPVDIWTFSARLTEATGQECTFKVFENSITQWSAYGVFGDKIVLAVPSGCKITVPGLTELKASEFHAIVEEYEAAQKVKAA